MKLVLILIHIMYFNLLSFQVSGHMDYSRKLTEVLEAVGVKVTPHSSDSSENLAQELAKQASIANNEKYLAELEKGQEAVECEGLVKTDFISPSKGELK